MEKIVYIDGMKCGGCANRVKNALSSVKGIKHVDVSLENKCATFILKKDISNDEISKVIDELGFKVTNIEDK